MSIEDWAWLCKSPKLCGNIYIIDEDSRSAHTPSEGCLPWPTLLLLGSYSKKHCFSTPCRIKSDEWSQPLEDFVNKIKWAWKFRANDNVEQFAKPLIKRATKNFDECSGTICDAAVKAYCGEVKQLVEKSFKKANARIARCPAKYSNRPGFVSPALSWLGREGLRAVPSDKDGVFTIITGKLLNTLVEEKIREIGFYRRVYEQAHEDTYLRIRGWTARTDSMLWKNDMRSFAAECGATYRGRGAAGMLTPMQVTVKTHKPKVEVRLIHASCGTSLEGYAAVLHRLLSKYLGQAKHLVADSRQLIKKVSEFVVPPNAAFAKWDVKNFYMNGDHKILVELVSKHISDASERSLVADLMWLTLSHQYVAWMDQVYHVTSGSGMGQIHSGTVADLAFHTLVEAHIETVAQDFGLVFWVRFGDDLLVVTKNDVGSNQMFKWASERASPHWKLESDPVTKFSVSMLDVTFYRGHRWLAEGKLDHTAYVKPTARHVPLGYRSMHHERVHKTWPVNEMARLKRLCLHECSFAAARAKKLDRFAAFFMRTDILERCRSWSRSVVQKQPKVFGRCVRIVLPYHPAVHSLSRCLREHLSRWIAVFGFLGFSIQVQVAYRLAAKPLLLVCRGIRGRAIDA